MKHCITKILLILTTCIISTTSIKALDWADFYHDGCSIYEAEAYGRIVEDAYGLSYPWHHETQFETQYFHPSPNIISHTFSRVRHNATDEEKARYDWIYQEFQQLVLKNNTNKKRVIVWTGDRAGSRIYRNFSGNLELKECKEPYRNDVEIVGNYRFVRRHTEQKVYSIPSWLDPHLADVQNGQVVFDAAISIGAQVGLDLGTELAAASIPWRVAGKGFWKLVKYAPKLPDLPFPVVGKKAADLAEHLAMYEAMTGAVTDVAMENDEIGNPKYAHPGWKKMRYVRKVKTCGVSKEITIHYMHNYVTNEVDEFKFKYIKIVP